MCLVKINQATSYSVEVYSMSAASPAEVTTEEVIAGLLAYVQHDVSQQFSIAGTSLSRQLPGYDLAMLSM